MTIENTKHTQGFFG